MNARTTKSPPLLTPHEFDRLADLLATIALAQLDTAREDAVLAGETLDRLARLRHLLTDPLDLRVGWRR